jgi:hypothetical protein
MATTADHKDCYRFEYRLRLAIAAWRFERLTMLARGFPKCSPPPAVGRLMRETDETMEYCAELVPPERGEPVGLTGWGPRSAFLLAD